MGYFSDLVIQVEEAYAHGATIAQIAECFDISVAEVKSVLEMKPEADRDFALQHMRCCPAGRTK